MLGLIKIAGVSAILSAGLVTAVELPSPIAAPVSGKLYTDRVPDSEAGAVLSNAVAYAAPAAREQNQQAGSAGAKKGDSLRAPKYCAGPAWPDISRACLAEVNGEPAPRAVRTITIEHREGHNVSVLVRTPVGEMASR